RCHYYAVLSVSHHLPLLCSFFFLLLRPPPTSTLFPYTTLFRSVRWRRKPVTRAPDQPPRRVLGGRGATSPRLPVTMISIVTGRRDRKSTRLNSSHRTISYAVFCLKKKKKKKKQK